MIKAALSENDLNKLSTEELKDKLLELTKDRDTDPLSKKIHFYKDELKPFCDELSRRNELLNAEEQLPIVVGVWLPVWSTIPFQDILPGRIHDQSYQIFHNDGYYANIARYVPGHKVGFLQKLSSFLLVYDLMLIQKYDVQNGQWFIQNVGIEQAFRMRSPLTADKAEDWFTKIAESKLKTSAQTDPLQAPELKNLDEATVKKFKQTYLATPQLEHLYIDRDFRLVKSQREAKQRPSYTIAVRQR